jgi:hypothetical protein
MARHAPQFVEDQALHVIQRSNRRQEIFYAEGDCVFYRDWLAGWLVAQIPAWELCKDGLPQGSNNSRTLLISEYELNWVHNTELQPSPYRLVFVRGGRTSSDCSQTGFVIMREKVWQ